MKIPRIGSSRRSSNNKVLKRLIKLIRSKRIIIAVIAIALLIFLGTRGGADTSKIKTVQVEEKTLEISITASGKVKSKDETNLRFLTSGKLAWLNVGQGDFVRRGQTIASLDAQELEKRLQKDLNLYFKTRLDFEDVKDSQKDKVITDTLKRIAQRSQADLDNSVIDVEVRDLAIKFSKLTSPISGYIVDNPEFFAGSFVFPTDTIVQIANFDKLQFVAEVDETEIGKINVSQKAKITLDAFPEQPIETTVSQIAPKAITTSTGATAFEVIFELAPQPNLKLGMNGEVNVISQTAQNALIIPTDTLIDGKFVWVVRDGKYQKKEVVRGLESETEIQISGLEKNQTVVTTGFEQINKKSLFQKLIGLIV